jgi:hypothetical protein
MDLLCVHSSFFSSVVFAQSTFVYGTMEFLTTESTESQKRYFFRTYFWRLARGWFEGGVGMFGKCEV